MVNKGSVSLVLGGERVRPCLCWQSRPCQNSCCARMGGMREVWHPSFKPWCVWHSPQTCSRDNVSRFGTLNLWQIVNWLGCSSFSLNKFLAPPSICLSASWSFSYLFWISYQLLNVRCNLSCINVRKQSSNHPFSQRGVQAFRNKCSVNLPFGQF